MITMPKTRKLSKKQRKRLNNLNLNKYFDDLRKKREQMREDIRKKKYLPQYYQHAPKRKMI